MVKLVILSLCYLSFVESGFIHYSGKDEPSLRKWAVLCALIAAPQPV